MNEIILKYANLAALFSLASLSVVFMPYIGSAYYILMGALAIYAMIQKNGQWDKKMFFLLAACVLSIVLNDPPAIFHSWERFALFVLIMLVASPLYQNKFMNAFRIRLFTSVMWLLLFITIGSCVAYYFGIDFSLAKNAKIMFFGGITNNSIVLASCAGISFLYLLNRLLSAHYPIERKKLYLTAIISLLFASFITLLVSGSRGGLSATVAGTCSLFYKYYHQHFFKLMLYIAAFCMIAAASYPLWAPYTKALQTKQEGNNSGGSATASRDSKWEARADEFKSSPVFGIGFSTVALEHTGDYIANGIVETGTSWGGILSMVGLLGFIPLLGLFIKNLWFLLMHDAEGPLSGLLGAVLCWFSVHMLVEGYIFAGGSFLCFISWLTIGAANAHRTQVLNQEEREEVL